jgi:flagellar basal body-associated protein FliL
MVKNIKTDDKKRLPKVIIVSAIALALIVAATVSYYFYDKSGWPGYVSALHECGNKPPVEAKSFITSTYIKPDDEAYRIPGEKGYRTYYCSENKAQAEGYKHYLQ